MEKERIVYLLQQYAGNLASREEVEELFAQMRSGRSEEALQRLIADAWKQASATDVPGEQDWERMWSVIQSTTSARPSARILSMRKMQVAAAIVLLAGIGTTWWGFAKRTVKVLAPVATAHYKSDVAPGGNRAVLTLGNGSTIILDSAHDGMLARQGNTNILKLDAGALAYNAKSKNDGEVMYNTIATPTGGQYQIVLPDGSKVWLNAASSLRFPTSFTGKERSVELTGEAYFEIAKNASAPFHVKIPAGRSGPDSMDVAVLGTNFDIMAYGNEPAINTTLLEGSVKVINNGAAGVKLEPGRQSVIDRKSHTLQVADANVDQVMAWKNGLFRFRETGIRELMRQVERWYNVEVVYQTDTRDKDYTGVVSRNQNVSALLATLELTGTVHFQVEGKKIIVLP